MSNHQGRCGGERNVKALVAGVIRNEADAEPIVSAVPAPACWTLPCWQALQRRCVPAHPFGTLTWHRAWHVHLAPPDSQVETLEVRSGGEPVALIPCLSRRGLVEFAGGVQVTDFLGPLCSSDSAEAAATSLVTWFASIGEHTSLDARNMLPESGFPAALAVAAEDMGLMSRMADDELTVRLALPTSWEAYLDGLEKKHRHELLRKQRRYEAAVGKPSARVASAGTLNRDFATFTTLMHNARGAKRAFLTPPVVAFWWTLLHDPQDSVGARLHLLEADGRCLAATFGFNIGARYFLYNSVYDSTRGDLSPGLVLLGWLIQDAIERGAVVFDFLRGAERYKFDLGGAAHPLVRVRVAAR